MAISSDEISYGRGRGRGTVTFSVVGLTELRAQISRIGKFPKKYLTKAARLGMAKPLADAKAAAPVGKTGLLKKGLKRQLETPNKRNKGVYRLVWDKKLTSTYLKETSGAWGGQTPNAYYPHSIEYGYKKKYGRVEGQYFARDAIEKNEKNSIQIMTDSLWDDVNRLTR